MNETATTAPSDRRSHLPEGVRPVFEGAPFAAFFLRLSSGASFATIAATLTRLAQGGIGRSTVTASRSHSRGCEPFIILSKGAVGR